MTPAPIAVVDWVDSSWFSVDRWFKADDPDLTPMHFRSVGFLIRDDETCVALATDYADDRSENPYRDVMVVPRAAVVEIRKVEGPGAC